MLGSPDASGSLVEAQYLPVRIEGTEGCDGNLWSSEVMLW
jgi:hypothetical protein